jgi:hypothetical protein
VLRRIARWLNSATQITRRRQSNRRRGYLDLRQ